MLETEPMPSTRETVLLTTELFLQPLFAGILMLAFDWKDWACTASPHYSSHSSSQPGLSSADTVWEGKVLQGSLTVSTLASPFLFEGMRKNTARRPSLQLSFCCILGNHWHLFTECSCSKIVTLLIVKSRTVVTFCYIKIYIYIYPWFLKRHRLTYVCIWFF